MKKVIRTIEVKLLKIVYVSELINLMENLETLKKLEKDPKYYKETIVLFGSIAFHEIDSHFTKSLDPSNISLTYSPLSSSILSAE